MEIVLAMLLSLLLGLPLYLPWILARTGIYRRWYIARFMPPFSWSRSVYLWPMSALFVSTPCVYLLGLQGDDFNLAVGIIGIIGVILAIPMAIWTPRWAKPKWQRYLEDHYTDAHIRRRIPIWREMDNREWSTLLDSEAGIDELMGGAKKQK